MTSLTRFIIQGARNQTSGDSLNSTPTAPNNITYCLRRNLPWFEIDDAMTFENVPIFFIDDRDGHSSMVRTHDDSIGIIGVNILEQHRCIFDYGGKRIGFVD